MNPSDTFESFDMNNFDDFLARESLEEEANTGSNASSYSDSFDMMPVYRSLDVMMPADLMHMDSQRQSGLDMVFEAPVLSRHHQDHTKETVTVPPQAPVDDLFAQLEADLAHTSLPSCHKDSETQPLGGIALSTSVEMKQSLSALTTTILSFLKSRGVHFDHCEMSSQFKCGVTDFVDSCKFQIQIYSSSPSLEKDQGAFTVEFLRISGSSLLFSEEFQHFKSKQQSPAANSVTTSTDDVVLSDVTHLAAATTALKKTESEGTEGTGVQTQSQQAALESFVSWAGRDPAEATRAVCGLFSDHSGSGSGKKKVTNDEEAALSPLLQMTSSSSSSAAGDQLSSEGILVMTLLGALCMHFKQQEEDTDDKEEKESTAASSVSTSALPLLSLLHLLLQTRRLHSISSGSSSPSSPLQAVLTTLIDSLTPASDKLANSTDGSVVSACERQSARHLMARIMSHP